MRKRKLYCNRGHERTPESVDANWACKKCKRINSSASEKANRTERNAYRAAWRKEHPNEDRASSYKTHYGEPIENKIACLEAQGYKCANQGCLKPIDMTSGHQDHNHETEERRGVLCQKCNQALGLLKDNSTVISGS